MFTSLSSFDSLFVSVQLKWCEEVDLSHKTLVRQSCQLGVDSVTRILCETVAAYQDAHDKYRNLLDRLIDSLEFSRTAEGVQQELLDCKLIMMRAEMEEMKGRIMELECFLGSIQRLSDSMAETAFLGNAEYHSVAMSERLDSALREVRVFYYCNLLFEELRMRLIESLSYSIDQMCQGRNG